jgi:catechol 2,3-dioxygenase-like lactoylglutathione lyase family enzyme
VSSVPMPRIDHIGYVVTDLDQACRFFVDVLGAVRHETRKGALVDATSDSMTRRFGVDARAHAAYAFIIFANVEVELMQWTSPTRSDANPSNEDAGGRHVAVVAPDMAGTLERIRAFGGCEIREPNERGFIYVKTPFGLEVQLIPAD